MIELFTQKKKAAYETRIADLESTNAKLIEEIAQLKTNDKDVLIAKLESETKTLSESIKTHIDRIAELEKKNGETNAELEKVNAANKLASSELEKMKEQSKSAMEHAVSIVAAHGVQNVKIEEATNTQIKKLKCGATIKTII